MSTGPSGAEGVISVGILDGKVAIVTGASRGIGAEIARRFGAAGAAVAVCARTTGAGESHFPARSARPQGQGWILNISSGAARHPAFPPTAWARRGGTVYGMCKAALERFSTGLAAELYDDNIAVNALSPSKVVPTAGTIFHHLTTEDDPDAEPPAVMAEAALLLCSAELALPAGHLSSSCCRADAGLGPEDAWRLTGPACCLPDGCGWTVTCTRSRRADAVLTLEQLAERAQQAGLDVVCVTDHNVTSAAIAATERDLGVRVIVGEEIRTPDGDVIGLFLAERIPYVLPLAEVVGRIRTQGGLVYAPHPFDQARSSLGRVLPGLCAEGGVDIVEVFNAKIADQALNDRAAGLAAAYDLPGGAGSDAHDAPGVGAAYLEMPDFDGPAGFLAALAGARVSGEFRPHAPRHPRRP